MNAFAQMAIDPKASASPAAARGAALNPKRAFVIAHFDGKQFRFIRRDRRQSTDLGTVDGRLSPGQRPDAASELLIRQIADSRAPVVLRMSDDLGLVSTDRLPENAALDLRAVVGHRLDSLTPWGVDKACFDARVIGKDGQGQIDVLIAAVDRATVDRGLTALASLGLSADVVDMVIDEIDEPVSLNFLAPAGTPAGGPRSIVLTALAATICLAMFGYLAFDYWSRQGLVDSRQAFAAALESRLADLPQLTERIDALKTQAGLIDQRKSNQPSTLRAVEALSRLLPDGVWLKNLSIDTTDLTIAGYAPDAEQLLALLESSDAFVNVEFRAPSTPEEMVIGDRQVKADSFALGAQLDPKGLDRSIVVPPAETDQESR